MTVCRRFGPKCSRRCGCVVDQAAGPVGLGAGLYTSGDPASIEYTAAPAANRPGVHGLFQRTALSIAKSRAGGKQDAGLELVTGWWSCWLCKGYC